MNRTARLVSLLLIAAVAATLRGQGPTTPPFPPISSASWGSVSAFIDTSKPRSPPPSARLANLSIRARSGPADDTLIASAVVQGAGTLPVLVRAIGPGLQEFGVAGVLPSPVLRVYQGAELGGQSIGFGTDARSASAYVGAFAPSGTRDVAIAGAPGAGLMTAQCLSGDGATGVALLEFYDATPAPVASSARFANFSSRARVEAGDGLVMMGFVVAGEGGLPLLLRASGPSLAQFGVAGVLADPRLELYSGNTLVASNDNWSAEGATSAARVRDTAAAAGAFAFTSASDAALLVSLPAGAYTLHVRGAGAQTGVALAEIFQVEAAEPFDAAAATNRIGLELYRELAKTRSGQNLVLSPYSIETALALAYAGADGDNRTEMARALGLPAGDTALQLEFARLRDGLRATADASKILADARTRAGSRTDPIEWNEANRLFGQQGYPFRDAFLALMRDGFSAPLQLMDFRASPEPSRLAINGWVEEQTRQKIKDLIPAGGITGDSRLVLVNALYLKAPWHTPFEKFLTAPRTFNVAPGNVRQVPTMTRTESLGYATEAGFTIVKLPYLGSDLHFLIMLPDANQDLDAAAARLTAAHLSRWATTPAGGSRLITLHLPKFIVPGSTVPLGPALRASGMRSAFDLPAGSANFDGIAPRATHPLAVQEVFHQTFIALDEEGTEAAAATAVVIGTTSATINRDDPIIVRVDRPFLFAIQHRTSGACLFFGRISDPR